MAQPVKHLYQHPEFRIGFRDILPVAPGIAAWGLVTGVAMVKSGLSTFESVLMTLLVFAGSSQLAALPLLAAGAPLVVILATCFCVNLRFVVFSLHLRPYLLHQPLWQRLLNGYLTADLSYVMFTRRFAQPSVDADERRAQQAYLAGNCALMWLAWVIPSLLGTALAGVFPTAWGLGFAGVLALLGVMLSMLDSHSRIVSAGIAGAAAVAAFALPFKLNIVVAIAAAVAFCLLLEGTGLLKSRVKSRGKA